MRLGGLSTGPVAKDRLVSVPEISVFLIATKKWAVGGGSLEFGHFRGGTDVRPGVDAWIAAQRLNR